MTLGDLLRQDGAFALLAIGAVLGFLAGAVFRGGKAKREGLDEAALSVSASAVAAAMPAAAHSAVAPVNTTAVIAAITSAVNRYRNEHA